MCRCSCLDHAAAAQSRVGTRGANRGVSADGQQLGWGGAAGDHAATTVHR
jgi:hypothetical protein